MVGFLGHFGYIHPLVTQVLKLALLGTFFGFVLRCKHTISFQRKSLS